MKLNKLSKFLRLEDSQLFTIDDIGTKKIKNGILVLDTNYFNIFLITLDKTIDDRERALDIEEYLEEYLDDYNHFNYIEKEIVLYKDENLEKILIILLKRDLIEEIVENCLLEKINLEGIYPIFFMEFFNNDGKEKQYLEVNENNFYIFSFKDDRLINFKNIDFTKEELLINLDYLKDFLDLNSEVFTYQSKEIYLMMDFLTIKNFKGYLLKYRKDLDFLPFEYRENTELKKITKYLFLIFVVIILIFLIISLLLNIYINKSRKDIDLERMKIEELKEKIIIKKEEIIQCQNKIEELEKKEKEKKNIKITPWLEKILKDKKDIDIKLIEYVNNKIYIYGNVRNRSDFYRFQKELLDYNFFKELNHDFFKHINNEYEFKIEGTL